MRLPVLVSAAAAVVALPISSASAAETLGARDLASGSATVACPGPCTAVQQDPTPTSPVVAATADGVLVSVTWRHGAWTDPPGEIGIVPGVDVRIVSNNSSRAISMSSIPRQGDLTDTVTFKGVQVKAGDRIGISINRGGVPLFRPGSGGAAGSYSEGSSSYSPIAGELLVQARIEPDADGDGLGDETQDPTPPKGPAPSPSPAPTPSPSPSPSPGLSGASLPSDFPLIEEFHAQPIEAYQAAPIGFYKAKEIKRLPARTNMYDAVMKGFSTPVRCPYVCAYAAYTSIFSIGNTLAGAGLRQRSARQSIVVGTAIGQMPGPGAGRVRLRFDKAARRVLLRARKPVRTRVTYVVADEEGVKIRRQTVTLLPRKGR